MQSNNKYSKNSVKEDITSTDGITTTQEPVVWLSSAKKYKKSNKKSLGSLKQRLKLINKQVTIN